MDGQGHQRSSKYGHFYTNEFNLSPGLLVLMELHTFFIRLSQVKGVTVLVDLAQRPTIVGLLTWWKESKTEVDGEV